MAIKFLDKDGKSRYKCSYCNKIFSHPTDADSCRDSHDLVYIQLSREEVSRLIQFIMTKNDKILTENIVRSLQKHLWRPEK